MVFKAYFGLFGPFQRRYSIELTIEKENWLNRGIKGARA